MLLPMIMNENDVTATIAASSALPDSCVILSENCETRALQFEDERGTTLGFHLAERP
jgi:hypothetical protein